MNEDTVRLIIDGIAVKSQPGLSLLLAARAHGIDIPTLCHHDDLKPEGHCRLCLVEIGPPDHTRLVNSCTYPVEPGLIVQTASEKVLEARRMVLELLLAQAPAAELIQKMAAEHGVYETRFK
ncbi:MAG: 2Fe-2S iron-sulfur cluster-binding protein, partial [Desulfobaccales bacterium]